MSMHWKLQRLRAMSAGEVVYRVKSAARSLLERQGIGLTDSSPGSGRCGAMWTDSPPRCVDVGQYRSAADRILAGRLTVFSLEDLDLGFPPLWNRNPKSGTDAPLTFGKAIDYRDEKIVGDIKYLWEPSRHLHLVTLAQAWRLTGEARYADGVRTLLDSWFDQCPYPHGVHWTSSLEHAVRLLNWYFTWHLLGGDASPLFEGAHGKAFRSRWQTVIGQHCHFIAGHLSLYSSANNHLLGEYLGLLVGSVGWPLWPRSTSWREVAVCGLEQEALRQNARDGVNREQAFYYHHEVAHMMMLAGLIGRANGVSFSAEFWQRLRDMLSFVACVMDADGHVPMVGDADDARMVRLSPAADVSPYGMLLAGGAVLFEDPFMARQARAFGDDVRWLLGDEVVERLQRLQIDPAAAATSAQRRRSFPEGGYYLLGDRFGEPDEVLAVADAGPLGYLSIAAHGHADALSIVLSVGGHEFLIDPGTYAYHAHKVWRDYFRGTAAHNTVRIDGVDQSVSGGNFLWLTHALARCEQYESTSRYDRFVGLHTGYQRLKDPVIHRREVVFEKMQRLMTVTDTLNCLRDHDVELLWHFAEDCIITLNGNSLSVVNGPSSIHMFIDCGPGFTADAAKGRENPPLGWISRQFDRKVPTQSIRWIGRISGTTVLRTEIAVESRHVREKPEATATSYDSPEPRGVCG
jgi:hypothetical protein